MNRSLALRVGRALNINLSRNLTRVLFHASKRTHVRTTFQQLRFHSDNSATLKVDDPQMMIAFTCKKCDTRSSHTFSKQAYQTGTVLIQCPGCKNRHLIADNLNFFKDQKFSLEDVLKAKGESIATSPEDLVFNDIPDSLKKTIGHHAKDAPEDYHKDIDTGLPEGKKSD
ncbi:mitochondrial protein import protein Zim17p [[Candida] jaroonii]|uniref:Mitochondrial protein import protein Zim17p n=1 Tax=[Candida] jaroonii TaxID=467808 RepID=A0ACA9YFD5_9ASCO|nr:mitochondrial protein import protein Zim17p [[Candida] jaroonii]